ncbi:MAG: hypothetical protein R3C62_10210 [Chloroflexota bacterium]
MYHELGSVQLRDGERVAAAVVTGPDGEWAARLEGLLQHKGEPWNWQNSAVLRQSLGLEVRFYILHRDGMPFANILTVTRGGVGTFGHVWTNLDDRRKGASTGLMELLLPDFAANGGRALYLHTGYESVAYWLYERFGFRSFAPQDGHMAYFVGDEGVFLRDYFAGETAVISPLSWHHWPTSQPLFAGAWPGYVRCAPLGLTGRQITEEAFLPLLRQPEAGQTAVLVQPRTGAVCGFACWQWHPIWWGIVLLDVYCHPRYWDRAGELLAALSLPEGQRLLAYADGDCPQKWTALQELGLEKTAVFPPTMPVDPSGSREVGIVGFVR